MIKAFAKMFSNKSLFSFFNDIATVEKRLTFNESSFTPNSTNGVGFTS